MMYKIKGNDGKETKRSHNVLDAMMLHLWSDVYETEAMRLRLWISQSDVHKIEAMR
jgi:hypothetical protein